MNVKNGTIQLASPGPDSIPVLDKGHLTPTIELSRVSVKGMQSMDIVGGIYSVS
jgi:hypothetical protein